MNAFINKPEQPNEQELAVALGPAKPVWDQLLAELDREFGVNIHEWNCYSVKAGWSLRVKRKARTIVWLGPRANAFTVAFILGDKAMQAARQLTLPQRVAKAMNEASKYAEGTGVRLTVKSSRDLPALKKLAVVKLAN